MNKTSLIEFPCNFPVKIIGENTDNFLEEIKAIVLNHFPEFIHSNLRHRGSGNNNFLAITVTVYVTSQEMLDKFYLALHECSDVKMVL